MAVIAHDPARPPHTHGEITADVLRTITDAPTKGYYILVAVLAILTLTMLGTVTALLKYGLGLAGYAPPVMWAVYITTFVFWVGIGHAGTLISAILFLFRSPWRTAVYRSTEAMTVFAVMTAALFPIIHIGRQWVFYWLIPYPNARFLWPNFKSPLLWDVFAISTYLTVSSTFLMVGLVPDIAAVRDHVSGWRKKLYSALSLGWTGADSQWRHYTRAYLYLAALATPLVLSVHSVVSWDFAVSIVPGWHGTIFAPYFVAGAIYSGIGMVLTLMIPLRKVLKLDRLITDYHFDNLAKLTLLTGTILFYAYAMEYFVAWYSGNTFEQTTFWRRAFGPMWWAGWTMIGCNAFVSQLLWFKKIRTNLTALFVISIFINLGMWFERYVIVVSSLSNDYVPYAWAQMNPTWADWLILLGSFGWFGLWFSLFYKNFPIIAIQELKEMIPMPRRKPPHGGGALMATRPVPGVLGSFVHVDGAADAIRELKSGGFADLTVYSAAPNHELEEAIGDPISGARLFTLVGGVLGCSAGFALALWMSRDWPLLVGGKPIATITPYVVIGFELTILTASLLSVIAIILLSARKSLKGRPYHPSYSDDQIGIFVPCAADRAAGVEEALRRHGAVEVSREG